MANPVVVHTEGGASGNPGPGGYGAILEWGGLKKELTAGYRLTTNNRMELKALIEAFKKMPGERELIAYSDSQLCVNTINEWAPGWEKRGWKRKGGPIKNLELVQELYALAQEKPMIELRWIRAHEGTRWNEYADALAALDT